RTFTVSKVNQTITFTSPGNKTMLQSPVAVTATSSSGLAVALTSSTFPVCTVAGGQITLKIPGTCTIAANQAGNGVYNAAPTVSRSFAVSKVNQAITFTSPGNKTLLQSPVAVTATSNSGLAVSLASSTTTVCTVAGGQITLKIPGTCTITAKQAGDTVYNAAPTITRSFNVT